MNLRDQYIKDGYIILRKFFEKEKLVSLKEEFLKIGNNFEKEILEYEFVKNLYLNDKFVNVIKILLNTDKLVYFSDSSVVKHNNVFSPSNGYHNDSRSEDYNFSNEYPLLRVATYLQESINISGGIKIKPGSQNFFCFTLRDFKQRFKILIKKILSRDKNFNFKLLSNGVQPKMEVGDLIIWNLRTHHSGTSIRYKFHKNLSLHPIIEKILPNFLKIPCNDRVAIFMVFGNKNFNNYYLDNYIKNIQNKRKIKYENLERLKSNLLKYNIQFIPSRINDT